MDNKIKVAIIFGGKSDEHEVSLMSASSVISEIDKTKYEVLMIGITKKSKWLIYDGAVEDIETGVWEQFAEKRLKENPAQYTFSVLGTTNGLKNRVDVVFPVLHGPYGEDGTMQGLLEIADIPYVGSGVLGSSVAMDKIYAKKVFEAMGLPICKYTLVMRNEIINHIEDVVKTIKKEYDYPVFIKPANLGSSVGISKVHNDEELEAGLKLAAKYDRKIVIEENIDCREIEVAVIGNDEPEASVAGEIIASKEFYDYQAKYFSGGESKICIPAELDEQRSEEVRKLAVEAYKALDCCGFARVDLFIDRKTDRILVNEINTIPGFTPYSMYPLLWEATGMAYKETIDQLIKYGIERYEEKNK